MRLRGLGLVLAAGAALRFATLDTQSLWFDEAITARLLRMDLGSMLRAIPDSESSPPLYYVLAWLWTQVSGTGEVGMRSLSALLGTVTIALAWALARRLGGDRAGVVAAALVAVNPMLVWFSQEARAYALLALLGALSALLWLRALERPQAARRLLAWGAATAAALATHYYAVFLVVPQALWLVARVPGWRARATALALPAATGAALVPLALGQRANEGAAFISDSSLLTRAAQVPKQFLVGYDAPAEALLAVLSAIVLLLGLVWLARLTGDRARPELRATSALTAIALGLALLAAISSEDHLITRNVLAVLPLVLVLAAVGLASAGLRAAATATAAGCALGLVAVVGVALDKTLQREDWRGVAQALSGPGPQRLVSVTPASGTIVLQYYLPAARVPTAAALDAGRLDVVLLASDDPAARPRSGIGSLARQVPAGATTRPQAAQGETFSILRIATGPGQAPAYAQALTRQLGVEASLLVLPAQS